MRHDSCTTTAPRLQHPPATTIMGHCDDSAAAHGVDPGWIRHHTSCGRAWNGRPRVPSTASHPVDELQFPLHDAAALYGKAKQARIHRLLGLPLLLASAPSLLPIIVCRGSRSLAPTPSPASKTRWHMCGADMRWYVCTAFPDPSGVRVATCWCAKHGGLLCAVLRDGLY